MPSRILNGRDTSLQNRQMRQVQVALDKENAHCFADRCQSWNMALTLGINAVDFIIDTLSVNHRSPELEASSRAVTDTLYALHCQQQSNDPALKSATMDLQSQLPLGRVLPHYAGFLRASLILTRRSFTNTFRQRGRYFYRVVGPFAIIVLITLVYWRFGNDSLSVYTRLGYFQQSALGAIPGASVTLDLYPRQVR